MRILLGRGELTWDAVERRTDRYGTVRLRNHEENKEVLLDPAMDTLEGVKGRLVAEVVTPIKSPHCGDLMREIYPSLPEKGEIVILGEGALFIEHRGQAVHEKADIELQDDKTFNDIKRQMTKAGLNFYRPPVLDSVYDLVGLKPDDGRSEDWLDPKALFRVHSSEVNLYFEEE